jgi:hypothetical protein
MAKAPTNVPSYVHGASEIPLLGETIGRNLDRTVDGGQGPRPRRSGQRPSGHPPDHAQFLAAVEEIARGLLALGVEPGERVGIWSPNNAEWAIIPDGDQHPTPPRADAPNQQINMLANRAVRCLRQRTYVGLERRRIREATTSRMLTMPMSLRPSTTGRWRNPWFSITSRASSHAMSGSAVVGSLVIHAETGEVVRSVPEAAARSTSRSVRIPMSQGPCMTTAEPTRACTISLVTSATGRSPDVVRTAGVMTSRSWANVTLPRPQFAS